MSGTIVRVLPRTDFPYYQQTGLAAGQTTGEVVIATNVDLSMYREATLIARLHPSTNWAGGASVTIRARASAATPEDPGLTFRITSATLGSLTFTQGTDSAPALKLAALPANAGGAMDITIQAQQVTSTTMIVGLSIDLSLKS